MKQFKVLMLGESLSRQGGIVSVQKLLLEHAPSSITYQHLPTLVSGSGLNKALAFGHAVYELGWKLSQEDSDILHIHMSEGGSAFRQAITTLIAVIFQKPVIMHTHGPQFHLFYASLPTVWKKILGWSLRKCSRFIVLSESWRKYYVEQLGISEERVVVLPNAVKIPQQVPNRFNRSLVTFLFLGRIGQRKGAFDLVQAFAALTPEQKLHSKLILAGDGETTELRHQIEQLNLTDCVQVLDWINSEQRDVLLAEADVFVLPSYNEGLPMSILEAMSWGLAIITTPVGGIPEVITSNNGFLVEPGCIQQLTNFIQLLIENEQLRHELGNNARSSVTKFDIEFYLSSLIKIYYSALDCKD